MKNIELNELIENDASCDIPLEGYGLFNFRVLKESGTALEHIVLTKEAITPNQIPLVRIHSSCVTGDIFYSKRCDCNHQLHYSLKKISEEGGVLIYLIQEGRGIGLINKIKAYQLQEQGYDTLEANEALGLPADGRNYLLAALILKQLHFDSVRLLTNNPDKIEELKKHGIEVAQVENMPAFSNEVNLFYLQTKIKKFNHSIQLQ